MGEKTFLALIVSDVCFSPVPSVVPGQRVGVVWGLAPPLVLLTSPVVKMSGSSLPSTSGATVSITGWKGIYKAHGIVWFAFTISKRREWKTVLLLQRRDIGVDSFYACSEPQPLTCRRFRSCVPAWCLAYKTLMVGFFHTASSLLHPVFWVVRVPSQVWKDLIHGLCNDWGDTQQTASASWNRNKRLSAFQAYRGWATS